MFRLLVAVTAIALVSSAGGCQGRVMRAGEWGAVHTLAFGPDGAHLISGSTNGAVLLWDTSNGALVRTLSAGKPANAMKPEDAVNAVVLSSDGAHLLVAARDLVIYDVPTGGELMRRPWLPHGDSAKWTRPAQDGNWVALLEPQPQRMLFHEVALWDLREPKVLARWPAEPCPVCLAVSRQRQSVAAGIDNKVMIFGVAGVDHILEGHAARLRALAFSPDGSLLISVDDAWAVKIWDMERYEQLSALDVSDAAQYAMAGRKFFAQLAFSADGSQAAVGLGWTIVVVDARTGRRVGAFPVSAREGESSQDPQSVSLVGFVPELHGILTHTAALQLWRVPDGRLIWSTGEFNEGIGPVRCCFEKRMIATGGGWAKHPPVVRIVQLPAK